MMGITRLWPRRAGAPDPSRTRREAALCTLAIGEHVPFLRLNIERMLDYGAGFGFDVHIVTRTLCAERPAAWSKLLAIRDLLERYEFVWWVDADTLFVDSTRDIRKERDLRLPVSLVQHEYDGQLIPNCGVMAFAQVDESFQMIDDMWSKTEFIDHPWWENAALISLMGYDLNPCGPREPTAFGSRVQFLSNDWNSIEQDPAAKPAVLHYAGLDNAERMRRITRDAGRYPWPSRHYHQSGSG